MIRKFIYNRLKHRHFWRTLGFSELTELYISNLFRGTAIGLIGLFAPVFMLRLGYSLIAIFSMMAWYFSFRFIISDLLAGHSVARIGPKHSLLIGYGLLMLSSGLFITLPDFNWPIWMIGSVWGAAASFFFIPFNVGFSKIKHTIHGGKELSYAQIMERIGAICGPLLGGIIATLWDPKFIFLAAGGLLLLGAIPLLSSPEAVRIRQKLQFKGLNTQELKYDYLSFSALGIENTVCLVIWPLFFGLFVVNDQSVYAKLGLLTTLAMFLTIASLKSFGQLIDRRQGFALMRYSALINAFLHLIRPLATNIFAAFSVQLANESVTSGYRLPYFKAMYDAADQHPGYRIAYLTSMEMVASNIKAAFWWIMTILASALTARSLTSTGFLIAAVASVLILHERFKSFDNEIYQKA